MIGPIPQKGYKLGASSYHIIHVKFGIETLAAVPPCPVFADPDFTVDEFQNTEVLDEYACLSSYVKRRHTLLDGAGLPGHIICLKASPLPSLDSTDRLGLIDSFQLNAGTSCAKQQREAALYLEKCSFHLINVSSRYDLSHFDCVG